MHFKSLEKIEAAAAFLVWFQFELSESLQAAIRPHLAQPYQSALKILDCCRTDTHLTVAEIAEQTQLSRETTRQILKAFEAAGLLGAKPPTKSWQFRLPHSFVTRQNHTTPGISESASQSDPANSKAESSKEVSVCYA